MELYQRESIPPVRVLLFDVKNEISFSANQIWKWAGDKCLKLYDYTLYKSLQVHKVYLLRE